jgi:ComF family protein
VVGEALAGVLFPPRCALCGRELDTLGVLCPECERALPELEGPRCARCGEPVDDERIDLCIACGTKVQAIDRALFLGPYDGAWGDLVRMLKFDREVAVARYLGRRMADELREEGLADDVDLVTFVPMSRRDRQERSFNQAELLARVVARRIGCPTRRMLVKTVRTPPQGRLSAAERKRNLRGAFRPIRCEQGRVLLVDDICTTGSTVEECAQGLRRGGVQSVTVLAVARA